MSDACSSLLNPVMAPLLRVSPKVLSTASRPWLTWHAAACWAPFSPVLPLAHSASITRALFLFLDPPRTCLHLSLHLFFPLPGELSPNGPPTLSSHFLKVSAQMLLYSSKRSSLNPHGEYYGHLVTLYPPYHVNFSSLPQSAFI